MAQRTQPLSPAELRQRQEAARSPRHHSAPSMRQGSSGPPTRAAIGLFRQGQTRSDVASGRSTWDTRATELPAGAINARFKLHLPDAYRSASPEPAPRGQRKLAALRLGANKTGGQDVIVQNPQTMVEAHRHPAMRAIMTGTVRTIADHMPGTIATGHLRRLIPEGTPLGLIRRAYRHAGLLAAHKAGLGDYDFHMDERAKQEFGPLVPFMRYANRRVFDRLNTEEGLHGVWQPFRDQFGQVHVQRKDGKETGVRRMRMRPNDRFVKSESGISDSNRVRPDSGRSSGKRERPGNESGHNAHSGRSDIMNLARIALIRASAHHRIGFGGGRADVRGAVKHVPPPPGGDYPGRHDPSKSLKEAAKAVEAHYGIHIGRKASRGASLHKTGDFTPIIGEFSSTLGVFGLKPGFVHQNVPHFDIPLTKIDLGFTLGGTSVPNYNVDPERQLRRAIHPRLRRQQFRLRLNTQKHLRRLLNGGVTHQERWQLGASTRLPADPFMGKSAADLTARAAIGLGRAAVKTVGPYGGLIGGAIVGRHVARHIAGKLANRIAVENVRHGILHPKLKRPPAGSILPHGAKVIRRLGEHLTNKQQNKVKDVYFGTIAGTAVLGGVVGSGAALAIDKKLKRLHQRRMGKRSPVNEAADRAAEPTDAQALAGNYRMGHVKVAGHDVTIETPKGRLRRKVSRSGKAWAVRMPAHYGYIKRTEGADGDHVDVYLGPHAHRAEEHPVFVVDQQHADSGRFDEHKVMLGFRDAAHAASVYDRAFSDGQGPKRRRAVHDVDHDVFNRWLRHGDTTRPFGDQRDSRVRKQSGEKDLEKGLVGSALRYGALLARSGASSTARVAVRGRKLAGDLGATVADTPPVRGIGRVGRMAAAHPRVAPVVDEATRHGGRGLLAPANLIGRAAGRAIGGERGAKIGGNIGFAADYAPNAYAGYQVSRSLMGAHDSAEQRIRRQLRSGTTAQRAVGSVMNKSRLGLLGAGAVLGATAYANRHVFRDHPGARVAAGAALTGGALALATRGHAMGAIRRSSRAIYTHGISESHMKSAVREHMRVLDGATPTPDHERQIAAIRRGVKRMALSQAKQARSEGMKAIRTPKKAVAGAAAAGGAAGLLMVPRQERQP